MKARCTLDFEERLRASGFCTIAGVDEAGRARYVVQALVRAYLDDPSLLPEGGDDDVVTRVTDHVSGMTDRYAVRVHRDMFVPHEGPL